MLKTEVIEVAREAVSAAGYEWREPVNVQRHRRFLFFGSTTKWHVMTNAAMRGCNVNIWIDDTTGDIDSLVFAPR